MVWVTSLLSMQYSGKRAKTGWLVSRIMCLKQHAYPRTLLSSYQMWPVFTTIGMKYCSFDLTQQILIHSLIYKASYWFIDYWLTSSEQYYSYCQLYKTYEGGLFNRSNNFLLPLGKYGDLGMDDNFCSGYNGKYI